MSQFSGVFALYGSKVRVLLNIQIVASMFILMPKFEYKWTMGVISLLNCKIV